MLPENPADQPSPGQVQPSVFNRPVPPWVWAVLALLVSAAVMLLVINRNVMHVYREYFLGNRGAAQVPWTALVRGMDEAAVRRVMAPHQLLCIDDQTQMGERTCYAAVQKINDHRALTVAYFFQQGRLQLAVVHVPWWAHSEAVDSLRRSFGPSMPAKTDRNAELKRWTLPTAYVDINRDRAGNPLEWSAIVWTPRRTAHEAPSEGYKSTH